MQNVVVEVCVDSLASAKRALAGGVRRLELCSCLFQGGLTPSAGLLTALVDYMAPKNELQEVEVYVMLRGRADTFVYDDDDMATLLADASTFQDLATARPLVGRFLSGFVFGALSGKVLASNAAVDEASLQRLLKAIPRRYHVTFHRALDDLTVGPEPSVLRIEEAIDAIARVNARSEPEHAVVTCLLSSCGLPSGYAEAPGMDAVRRVATVAESRGLELMVGGGVTAANVASILDALSGALTLAAPSRQYAPLRVHFSAKAPLPALRPEEQQLTVDSGVLHRNLEVINTWKLGAVA